VTCLPENFVDDENDDQSAHECRFGFATMIPTFNMRDDELSNGAKGLSKYLLRRNVADNDKGNSAKVYKNEISNLTKLLGKQEHHTIDVGNPSSDSSADKEEKEEANKKARRKREEEQANVSDEINSWMSGDEIALKKLIASSKHEYPKDDRNRLALFPRDTDIEKLNDSIAWIYSHFWNNCIGQRDHLSLSLSSKLQPSVQCLWLDVRKS